MKFLERTKSPNGNFAELNHDPETFFKENASTFFGFA
jgi:hypothetical protein